MLPTQVAKVWHHGDRLGSAVRRAGREIQRFLEGAEIVTCPGLPTARFSGGCIETAPLPPHLQTSPRLKPPNASPAVGVGCEVGGLWSRVKVVWRCQVFSPAAPVRSCSFPSLFPFVAFGGGFVVTASLAQTVNLFRRKKTLRGAVAAISSKSPNSCAGSIVAGQKWPQVIYPQRQNADLADQLALCKEKVCGRLEMSL